MMALKRETSAGFQPNIRKKKKKSLNHSSLYGWLFVSPWLVGLLAFYGYPLVSSFYYSLTSYSILQPGHYVGLQNFVNLLHDKVFWTSIYNTVYFTVFFVPLSIIFGVILAMMLNVRVRGMSFYRTFFFLPTLVPHVALAVLWLWLLNPQYGLVNSALNALGIPGPAWLGSTFWSKPSLIFMSLWAIGQQVVIYLAGLTDIPEEYYDAAKVDGANWFQNTMKVTLPLLTPVIFFNLVMGVIGSFQQFTLPYTMTNGTGKPANSLTFYVMYLYNNGFQNLKMGYASAMAWILFIIIMACTAVIFLTSKRWVHYQGK